MPVATTTDEALARKPLPREKSVKVPQQQQYQQQQHQQQQYQNESADLFLPDCQCQRFLNPFPPSNGANQFLTTPFLSHYCRVCNIQLNSCRQAKIHSEGKKHSKRLNFLRLCIESGKNESAIDNGVGQEATGNGDACDNNNNNNGNVTSGTANADPGGGEGDPPQAHVAYGPNVSGPVAVAAAPTPPVVATVQSQEVLQPVPQATAAASFPVYTAYQIPTQFGYQATAAAAANGAYYYHPHPPPQLPPPQPQPPQAAQMSYPVPGPFNPGAAAHAHYAGFPPQSHGDYPPPPPFNPTMQQTQVAPAVPENARAATSPAAVAVAAAAGDNGLSPSMTSSGFGGSSGADCKSAETSSILSAASYSSSSRYHHHHHHHHRPLTYNRCSGYTVPPPHPPPAHVPRAPDHHQQQQQQQVAPPPTVPRGSSYKNGIVTAPVGGGAGKQPPKPKPLMATTIVLPGREFMVCKNSRQHQHPTVGNQYQQQQQQQHYFQGRAKCLQSVYHPRQHLTQHQHQQHHKHQQQQPNVQAPSGITNAIPANRHHQTRSRHSRVIATQTHSRKVVSDGGGSGGMRNHNNHAANANSSSMSSDISCEVCHVSVNSSQQLQAHLAGQKHRLRAIRRGLKPDQAAASPSSSTLTSASESDDCTSAAAKKINSRRNLSSSDAAKAVSVVTVGGNGGGSSSKAAAEPPKKADHHQDKAKIQKGHRHRSLTANGRGELGGCSLELSRHFSSSCLAAARLYYSHSRSTSSLRKAVSHSALNKSRSMNLLNNGFQRQCRLRQWDNDDSTSNEEGEVDDEDDGGRRDIEDDSGDLDDDGDEDAEAEAAAKGSERGQRAKGGKSDSAASSNEGCAATSATSASSSSSSSSSSALSFKGTKKKKQVTGNSGASDVPHAPKQAQSKKSKGCQTSGPFPYKTPAGVVSGFQKNVKIDKKTVNGKKSGIRQHSWRRQQQQQQQHQDPNNNSNTTAFKAMQGQGKAFREIPMLNMFLQRLQQHTNLATAAAILGTPANATAVPTPAAAAAVKQASSGHAKSIKHKNGGKKQKQQPQGKAATNNSGSVDISDCSSSSNPCEASTDS